MAHYGIPADIRKQAVQYLDEVQVESLKRFEAKITHGYKILAKRAIYTVVPAYSGKPYVASINRHTTFIYQSHAAGDTI